jgi:hypothetical protein
MKKEIFGLKVYQLIIILIVAILITLTYQLITVDKTKEEIREPIINETVIEEEIELTPGQQSVHEMNLFISTLLDTMFPIFLAGIPVLIISQIARALLQIRD